MALRVTLEPTKVNTKLFNKKFVFLGALFTLLITIVSGIESVLTRFDPSYHLCTDFPIGYRIFLFILVLTSFGMLVLYFVNIYKIFK